MMKKILIAAWVLSAVLLSACADWVNVSPKEEVESDKLFTSESGFKSALIGIYARMTLTETYGKSLSYGYIEELVQRYDNYDPEVGPTDAKRAERYDYKENAEAKNKVKSLWTELFRSVANINSLLAHLEGEGKQIVVTEGYWELMKGEALGLRAFHYFDLLRLFGPVYQEDPEMKCLPWRGTFDAERRPLLAAREIAGHIVADLQEAEKLLENDPMDYGKNADIPFLGLRKHRMNKMAVKALMARVYLWIGDKEKAAGKAREVIGGCGLELVTSNVQDVSLYGETLFALGMDDMEEKVSSDWKDITVYSNELYISAHNAETVFERSSVGINDIRYKSGYGFIHGTNGLMCRKYLGKMVDYWEKIPLIRLSEMYYILAECVTLEESTDYINKVRNARGISRNYNISAGENYDEAARIDALDKEYQKDFFAEGQYFYFLKRHDRPSFWRCPVEKMTYYVLPAPDDEIEYGIE